MSKSNNISKDLVAAAQNGNEEAITTIVENMMPFIISLAKKYTGRGLTIEDFISCGKIGVLKAIPKYNPDKGTKFSTYAYTWIRQVMGRAVEKDRIVKHAVRTVHLEQKYRKYIKEYETQNEESPTEEEIMEELNIDKIKLIELINICGGTLSLDFKVNEHDDNTTVNLLIQQENPDSPNPFDLIEDIYNLELLQNCLNKLDADSQLILSLRYGLYDGTTHGLQQTGNITGISCKNIRRIEEEALEKLKNLLLEGGYNEYED